MKFPPRLARLLLRRAGVPDSSLRHLDAFLGLGQNRDAPIPDDMIPSGSRAAFRAVRSRSAFQMADDWVWPWWIERQCDPRSPDFVPCGHVPVLSNMTHRNWTSIGVVSSPHRGSVDPRGLVSPGADSFSLDWWVRSSERWHLPSREVAVRQSLVGGSPVVETRMKVPGGDIVHRVYAAQSGPALGRAEVAIVEVGNETNEPVALALAVRPYGVEGLSVVDTIETRGNTILVDGEVAVILDRLPSAGVSSTLDEGDSSAVVLGDERPTYPFDPVTCPAGLAQAVVVIPLAHQATVRVVVPIGDGDVLAREYAGEPPPASEADSASGLREAIQSLPSAANVASGWQAQANRGLRIDVPEEGLQDAFDAVKQQMLLFHQGDSVNPGPVTYDRFYFRDAAFLLGAMGRLGFHGEVREVLASFPSRQRPDGFFHSQDQEWDANGAALFALADHWRLTRDVEYAEALIEPVAMAAHWIDRKRSSKPSAGAVPGLMPAGPSAEHLGPVDQYYWDDFWSLRGLRDAAELLAAGGHPEAIDELTANADEFRDAIIASLDESRERLGTAAMPGGPRRRLDAAAIGNLVACRPLGILDANDERVEATLDYLRDSHGHDEAHFHAISHTGLATYMTLHLAFVELAAGDHRAIDRLRWMLRAATPTFTWPEAIHPTTGGGCMGDGHHGWAAAEFMWFVRDLLVREVPGGVALLSVLPSGWEGQPIEVHDAATEFGTLSYAIRWHGTRPALLWELDPHDGIADVEITVPGLDPSWSSSELRGDALLGTASPEPPVPPAPPESDSPPAAGGFS